METMEFRGSSRSMMDMLLWWAEWVEPIEFIEEDRCFLPTTSPGGLMRRGLEEPSRHSDESIGSFSSLSF
ncbi:hypothetical protein QG37_01153 [Candidozyma auris]|nr:hypothetical protein QG37_01153 [[Candida] auris]